MLGDILNMLEYAWYMLTSIIGSIMGATMTYVVLKRMTNTENLVEKFNDFMQIVMSDTDMQKNLYSIGALIGSGAMAGTGIQKGGGKMNFNNLAMQILGSFFNKGQGQGETQSGSNPLKRQ